ncbi:MAG: DNA repair protein RadA [Treponema sp.]|nr:DNA repair protein RadA [Candidatus Treponema caballi]
MAKKKETETAFVCSSCGYRQPKWMGRCPNCGEWNTFSEEKIISAGTRALPGSVEKAKPIPLSAVPAEEGARLFSGIGEFDRVMGGGVMKRSATLVGGEPGIGKSTMLLQAAAAVAAQGNARRVLYVSGEESAAQIRNRADRLGVSRDNIELLCTSVLEDIENALNALNPVMVIVDSIQTIYSPEAGLIPGTINQLKYCANELVSWVKERDSVLFVVAHVTKDGGIAGPKALEHLVDTVLAFERNDDDIRFLRAQKNRFGSTDELGIFSMDEKGLSAVPDPSGMFVIKRPEGLPAGVAVVPVMEGTRVFMVEIQALTVPAKASITRVYSDNIDSARVSRVAAVLEKRTGIRFSDNDIYINVAGGVRLTESAVDAALAAALYSARTDVPLKENTAVVGELSLAGEIRPVRGLRQRVKTAKELGFDTVLVPGKETGAVSVRDVKALVAALFK